MADTLRHLKRAAKHRCDRDIKSLTKREVIEFLEQIATEHLTTANHVHASLSTMYRWAEEREIVDKSPLTGVARVAAEMERDRVLDVYEIRLVWEATKAPALPGFATRPYAADHWPKVGRDCRHAPERDC